jgi:hypothetical protein
MGLAPLWLGREGAEVDLGSMIEGVRWMFAPGVDHG